MKGIDAGREEAMELLSRAFAAGQLGIEDYETRIERVHSANSREVIARCIEDLSAPRLRPNPPPTPASDTDQTILSVLGSRSLRGNWLRHRFATSITLLGQTRLNLQDCELPEELTIHIVSVMGECRITVPEGVTVINSVTPLLAEVADTVPVSARPRSTVRLTGIALMSEVTIRRV